MKIEDPINIMIDLEKKFNLFDINIRNLRVWYFCRQEVNYRIKYSINVTNANNPINKQSKVNTINNKIQKNSKKAFLYLKSLRWTINKYKKTDILCLSNNNMRRDRKNGKEFDIIFDYIGEYLNDVKYSILNTFSGKQFTKNCYTKNCYNLTNYCLNIYLFKRYYNFILNKEEINFIKEFFKKIEDYIYSTYEIKVHITDIVLKNVAALIKSYQYAYGILKRMDPKVLYVECAYSNVHLPFIYAAKNLGKKVVEFQHGVISSRHLGYLFNNTRPDKDPIPDYICVYGKSVKKLLKEMNENLNIELVEYGYPYLNEKSMEVQNNIEEKKYKYLITTQGIANYKNWKEFIAKLLNEDKKGNILVKLHPNEINSYKDYYGELLKSDRVEFTIDKNVYECFKISNVHLSGFSTCHYESICCNLETIVVMFPGWEHVSILQEYGVKFVKDVTELIRYLDKKKCNIDFNKFKKDFFNIGNDEVDGNLILKKVNKINKYFINN